jgi:hypothetical protein
MPSEEAAPEALNPDPSFVTLREFSSGIADDAAKPSWIDYISQATREAPLQSLAVAFLVGAFLGRRR